MYVTCDVRKVLVRTEEVYVIKRLTDSSLLPRCTWRPRCVVEPVISTSQFARVPCSKKTHFI